MNAFSSAHPDLLVCAALEYAAAGIPVFPCAKKVPLIRDWRNAATTDPEIIARWWADWPEANIAILTGRRSNLLVVDLDVKNGVNGIDAYNSLGLPKTEIAALTPSGGGHAYFRWPGEGYSNTASRIAPGVDTRGEGGYVLVPPSSIDRLPYQWGTPEMVDRLLRGDVPDLPRTLRQRLDGTPGKRGETAAPGNTLRTIRWAEEALARESDTVHNAAAGERNDTLNRAAFNLGQIVAAGHLDRAEVEQRLETAALASGLSARESRLTIASGIASGEASPRGPAAGHHVEEVAVRVIPEVHHLEPRRDPPPRFPGAEVFGAAWGAWLEDVAAATTTPPDYAGIALLAAAASLAGKSRRVRPWGDWIEAPIIWGMAIGEPSCGKTPALSLATAPLSALEKKVRAAAEAELSAWRSAAELAKMHREKWESDVRVALKAGLASPPLPAEADPGDEPCVPRLVVQDVTVEKLGEILGGQPGGCLMFRDELAGFLQGMNRYNNGGGDRGFYLEAYNGARFTFDRLCREEVLIERLSVGLLGGIQPDRLASLLMKSNDNDGFLARFCPVWPEVVPVEIPTRSPDMNWAERAFTRIYSLEMQPDAAGAIAPVSVPFAQDAAEELERYYDQVRRTEHEFPTLLKAFLGKTQGMIARVSLVLALLDWAVSDEADPPREISLATFHRARRYVADYLVAMARRAYAEAAKPTSERGAAALLRVLRAERLPEISKSEIRGRKLDGLREAKDIDAALAVLVEANALSERVVPTGGRPKTIYDVNPAIWS
jgi:hypothetical protein